MWFTTRICALHFACQLKKNEMAFVKTRLVFYIYNPRNGRFQYWEPHAIFTEENDRTLADNLARKVRVFGMIITMPQNKLTKAIHAKETWARRLNGYIFISSEDDKNLRSIRVVEKEGRYMLWEKTRQAIIYAYRNHADEYDYFMKADDDTYVIVENLRYLLSTRIPDEPFFMGRRFIKNSKITYPSGGAGYVISQAALKIIAKGILEGTEACRSLNIPEDYAFETTDIEEHCTIFTKWAAPVQKFKSHKSFPGLQQMLFHDVRCESTGLCADALGVPIIDSLDEHGLECFHPFRPLYILSKEMIDRNPWIHSYNYHPMKTGLDCCSNHTASFHYISPDWMYVLEYLVYHLYPYGIARDLQQYESLLDMSKTKTDKE
ncbi:hypothetical protein ACTXT7_010791 [Hymenolepis weldensis]